MYSTRLPVYIRCDFIGSSYESFAILHSGSQSLLPILLGFSFPTTLIRFEMSKRRLVLYEIRGMSIQNLFYFSRFSSLRWLCYQKLERILSESWHSVPFLFPLRVFQPISNDSTVSAALLGKLAAASLSPANVSRSLGFLSLYSPRSPTVD